MTYFAFAPPPPTFDPKSTIEPRSGCFECSKSIAFSSPSVTQVTAVPLAAAKGTLGHNVKVFSPIVQS